MDTTVLSPSYRAQDFQTHVPKDIQHHFWHVEGVDEKDQPPFPERGTLNASRESDGKLAFVLVFHDAHPRWASDKVIYVKSNLELLPEYRERKDEAVKRQQEIAAVWGEDKQDDEKDEDNEDT